MIRTWFPILLFVSLLQLPLSAQTYEFNAKQSSVGFDIEYIAGTAHGEFREFEGKLDFNKQNPEQSRVAITIQVDSVDTDSAKRDGHLQEEDYFYSQKYPTIQFESKSFRKRGDNQYVVAGPLTIRGVSKPITLQVTLTERQAQWAVKGDALFFESEYDLNRMDFGVSGGTPGVNERLKVLLKIKAFETGN
jgi:polyisoprenoid-binding protein YceI